MPEYVVELEFMQKTDDRFHYEFRRDDSTSALARQKV